MSERDFMTSELVICGLDPGSTSLGWAILVATLAGDTRIVSDVALVASGVFSVAQTQEPHIRLAALDRQLVGLAEHRPKVVAVEAGFAARGNQKSALMVGASRGLCMVFAGRLGVPYYEYAPTTIKARAAGHGGASKSAVAIAMTERFGIGMTGDRADAVATALTHVLVQYAQEE